MEKEKTYFNWLQSAMIVKDKMKDQKGGEVLRPNKKINTLLKIKLIGITCSISMEMRTISIRKKGRTSMSLVISTTYTQELKPKITIMIMIIERSLRKAYFLQESPEILGRINPQFDNWSLKDRAETLLMRKITLLSSIAQSAETGFKKRNTAIWQQTQIEKYWMKIVEHMKEVVRSYIQHILKMRLQC